jgi:translocator protein
MNDAYNWYQLLIKPAWAPTSSLFGQVWSVLYVIIIITFGLVFYKAATGHLPWLVALPFALNLIFNIAFTPIQFGMKNNYLASIDVVLVVASLIWALTAIWPYMRWILYANIPYLLWGAFATVLQFTITWLNWE